MDATRARPVAERGTATPAELPHDRDAADLRAAVARAVRRICPRWLADEADDLTQIATVRLLGRLQDTAGPRTLTPGYLYRAAYSALVDEIRRRRRSREVPLEPEQIASPGAVTPERQGESADIRTALARCLSSLIAQRRRAVMLHLQGHSIAETGELLGCSAKSAENLVYRGLADMRACLTESEVVP